MIEALTHGLLAGYGIAIPVGAISVLIVETGIRRGFRYAAAAGAGAATADLIYAAVAAGGGAAIAAAVDSVATPFRYLSALVLAAIAVAGLIRARTRVSPEAPPRAIDRAGLGRTYRAFTAMTIINPLTIVYFTVFVVGSGIASGLSGAEGAVFVGGAFVASLSWQTLLAGVGGVAHHTLPDRFRVAASIGGNLIVLALAALVAFR